MAKYSEEFKLQLVQEYLEGPLGYTLVAKKYALSDRSILSNWVRAYKEFG